MSKLWEIVKDREAWHAAARGVELDTTEQLNKSRSTIASIMCRSQNRPPSGKQDEIYRQEGKLSDQRREALCKGGPHTWKRKASPKELLRQKTKSFLGCSGTACTMLFSTQTACFGTLLWSIPDLPSPS